MNSWTNQNKPTESEISVVIVNWNGAEFLPNCLESIAANPPRVPYEVIIVDNASTDGSPGLIKSWASACKGRMKVTLIQSEENLGFGRANNLAFDRIRSDYVLILNPDTIVKPSAIDNLVHAMESDGRVGLAGPRLLNADGTLQPSVWPHPPTLATVLLEGLKLYKFLPRRIRASWLLSRHWSHDTRSEVPALSGAVMFARRQMIDKVGGFANEIHMYGEDAEWCVRIRQSGWKLLFEPSAEIIHLGGQSAIQRWGESERHVVEEKAWTEFQARYQTPARAASTLGARAFLLILYFLKQTVQRNDTTLLRKLIQIQFKGLKSIFTSPDQPSARS